MSLVWGTRLGPYEVLALLGTGGMGEVYRARDTRLDRTVAIKILPAHLSNEPVCKQRFDREAQTISSPNDPHICVLYDVGHRDGVDYLVTECVEGEALASAWREAHSRSIRRSNTQRRWLARWIRRIAMESSTAI
jgi:serine/threonine protein kinase